MTRKTSAKSLVTEKLHGKDSSEKGSNSQRRRRSWMPKTERDCPAYKQIRMGKKRINEEEMDNIRKFSKISARYIA